MSEHHGSSSPETSSEDETASVTSFDDGDSILAAYHELKEDWTQPSLAANNNTSPVFRFSLLSACSAQGRAVSMCQYARSMTSQDVVRGARLRGE